jgi:hypothetical protein
MRLIVSLTTLVVALALALALALAACGPRPDTGGSPAGLSYSNQTSIPIDLVVNGAKIITAAPGTDGSVPASALPALPWNIEAQTSSGRALASLVVHPGDVVQDGNTQRGDGVRVDLSCGRLDVWSGPPLSGPAPGPGSSGDCDP